MTPTDPLSNALLPKRIRNIEALADAAGISRATAYRVFTSDSKVSLDVTIKLADALDIDPVAARDLIQAQRKHLAAERKRKEKVA
jgi:predicted transcriptional regulator